MTTGLLVAAALFGACAYMGEKNALWIPAVILLFGAAANVVAGPLLP